MVHYQPVQVIIDVSGLAAVILNIVIRHHSLLNLIVNNRGSVFIPKFWSFLYYFLNIKQHLSGVFHP